MRLNVEQRRKNTIFMKETIDSRVFFKKIYFMFLKVHNITDINAGGIGGDVIASYQEL